MAKSKKIQRRNDFITLESLWLQEDFQNTTDKSLVTLLIHKFKMCCTRKALIPPRKIKDLSKANEKTPRFTTKDLEDDLMQGNNI